MAVHQKLSEVGWFYHAPEPMRNRDPIGAPLASQIPGLNDLSTIPYDNEPRPLFRDSDTKYIRLAKKGGREDLLRMREPKPRSEQAAPYPRNDWFYLEDNRLEAEHAGLQPWEFRLPEYMVHDEHKPYGTEYDYARDPDSKIYWTKGRLPVGSREVKFNRRAEAPINYQGQTRSAPIRPETDQKFPTGPKMYDPKAPRPAMNKLLAYGYQNDGEKARENWYQELKNTGHLPGSEREEVQSTKHRSADQSQRRNKTTWNDIQRRNTNFPSKPKQEPEKKPFKISRFDKVGAKVNTQRVLPPI